MLRFLLTLALALPAPALADALVAARTLRSGTLLSAGDIRLDPQQDGAPVDPASIIGLELRGMLGAGRPIRPENLGPPTIVSRNQLVTLAYEHHALRIEVEGRALGAGGVGDVIRVMNSNSRTTVSGRIAADGTVIVAQN